MPIINLVANFTLFTLVIAVTPNFTESSLINSFVLIIPWSVYTFIFSEYSKNLSLREFGGHISLYIAGICIAILLYLQKSSPDILLILFFSIFILYLSASYSEHLYNVFIGALFFIICYLSVTGYSLSSIFKLSMIGPFIFSIATYHTMKAKSIAMITTCLSMGLYFFVEGHYMFFLYVIGVSAINFFVGVKLGYQKTGNLLFLTGYSMIFIGYLLYGQNLIQAL